MYYREGSREREFEPEISPPSAGITLAEIVHRAMFFRAKILEKENPGSRVEVEFQDDKPRGILWIIGRDGTVLWKEFVETTFSADRPERDKEYLDAAQRYHRLAIHHPAMTVPKEHFIYRLADLWVASKKQGVQGTVVIQGFLFNDRGQTVLEV